MNKWFEEIEKYSHRDQLSFSSNIFIWIKKSFVQLLNNIWWNNNYVIWKTGKKIKYISKEFALKYFNQYDHAMN